jgi:hypothetical protein
MCENKEPTCAAKKSRRGDESAKSWDDGHGHGHGIFILATHPEGT